MSGDEELQAALTGSSAESKESELQNAREEMKRQADAAGMSPADMLLPSVICDAVKTWNDMKKQELALYEKRTQVLERIAEALQHDAVERIAMAMEFDNEKKWASVR